MILNVFHMLFPMNETRLVSWISPQATPRPSPQTSTNPIACTSRNWATTLGIQAVPGHEVWQAKNGGLMGGFTKKTDEKWRLKQPEPMGFGQSLSRHSWRAMMAEALVIDPFPLMLAITTFLENFVDKSYSKAQFTSPEMEKIIKVGGHNNQTQLDV